MGDPVFVMNIELVCVRVMVQKVSRVPENGLKKLNVCLCPGLYIGLSKLSVPGTITSLLCCAQEPISIAIIKTQQAFSISAHRCVKLEVVLT